MADINYPIANNDEFTQHKLDYASQRSQDQLKVAKVEKDINDYQQVMSSVNVNQEAKQNVSGYGVVSLPKNAANGQVSASVKGETFSVKNSVANGNFANGFNGWLQSNAGTVVTENNICTFTPTGNPVTTSVHQHIYQSISVITGYKYYGRGDIYGNSRLMATTVDFGSHNSNSFKTVSGVWTSAVTDSRAFGVRSSLTENWTEIKARNLIFINLTEFYGAGNEPTQAELDRYFDSAIYTEGTETKSTISASRLKSVGKNLLDKNKVVIGRINSNGTFSDLADIRTSDYITVTPNTSYVLYNAAVNSSHGLAFFDANKQILSEGERGSAYSTTRLLTTGGNTQYLRCSVHVDNLAIAQLEKGTLATAYEPYTESTQYLPNVGELRSLPNGTKDEIRVSDGKLIKRVRGDYALIDADIVQLNTASVNTDYIALSDANFNNHSVWLNNANGGVRIDGFAEASNDGIDTPSKIGTFATSGNNKNIYLFVAKGTYANLAAAKTDLVGTTLTYQLAEPVEVPVETSGTLLSYPSGTIYTEPAVADAGIYTSEMTVLNQTLPIHTLEKISKIDFATGLETSIDTATAVIASDKKSFTHPSLASGDIVFFTYFYDSAATTQGETSITYYDSRHTLKDTVTGKFYKVVPTVADGVLTNGLVEV